MTFAPPTVGGTPVGQAFTGWRSPQATVTPNGLGLVVTFQIAGDVAVLRVASPADAQPVPALVDSVTAGHARGGLLQLALGQLGRVRVRVVATGERFPTTTGRFAVVDRVALARHLDDLDPGTGTPSEVWVAAPSDRAAAVGSALRAAPFDRLAVTLRAEREERCGPTRSRSAPGSCCSSRPGSACSSRSSPSSCSSWRSGARRRGSSTRWRPTAWPPRPAPAPARPGGRVVAVAVPAGLVIGLLLSRWAAPGHGHRRGHDAGPPLGLPWGPARWPWPAGARRLPSSRPRSSRTPPARAAARAVPRRTCVERLGPSRPDDAGGVL